MWHGALLLRGDPGAERVPDEAITVGATDLGMVWQVRKGPGDFIVERLDPADAPSGLSVIGRSDDLIPWLWGRTPASPLAFTGDTARIEAWNLSAHL